MNDFYIADRQISIFHSMDIQDIRIRRNYASRIFVYKMLRIGIYKYILSVIPIVHRK